MVSMAGAELVVTSQETGPEQLPVSPRLAPAGASEATQRNRLRPLEVVQCSLCGIALPLGLLVPDGGQARRHPLVLQGRPVMHATLDHGPSARTGTHAGGSGHCRRRRRGTGA